MTLLVKGSVKEFLKKNKRRIATATYERLENVVEEVLKKASERAERNGRTTVMPHDL